MSRNLSVAMESALDGVVSRPAIIGAFEFASGTVRLWSGLGDLVWNGDTYAGLGALLGVEYPAESNDGSANGATFTLSGVDTSWNALAFSENYQGRPCKLWYAELDGAGNAIADPVEFFPGIMDQMTVADDGATSIIRLTVERETLDNRPANDLYDDKTQQRRFAGDKGFEFLPAISDVAINWGVPGARGVASSPGIVQSPVPSPRIQR